MTPGRLSSVAGADDPSTVMEANLSVLAEEIYQRPATYQDDAQNTLVGPPTDGDHVLQEFWRDSLGAEFVCTSAGEPGTWLQIRPAIVTAEPVSPPTDYWILRSDQGYKNYTYTGAGFAEKFLALDGGTMTGALTLAADPTLSLQAATKAYVDALAGGSVDCKDSCRAATTGNVDLTTGGLLTIDGVTLVAGDRVLVKAQTAGAENGIYTVASGTWVRSPDADTSSKVTSGLFCFVVEGTTLGDMGYVLTTNDPITLGTTALVFAQFSKGLADGECTDVKIGNRTVDQSLATPADTGALTSLLSWMVGRLKAVTGKSDWKTTPQTTLENAAVTSLNFIVDGGGAAIATGQKGHLEIPFAGTIVGVTLLADQSGSIVLDLWKDTYANFPPDVADTIVAAAPPTISAATKSKDTTLTGWTTSVAAGDILAFNVNSAATVTRVTVSLTIKKT